VLLFYFFGALPLLCVVRMRGERSSFYRWRGGGSLEICLIPIWKEQTDLKPSFRYIEPGKHLDTDIGQGGMCQLTKAEATPGHRLALVGSWLGLDLYYVGTQPNFFG